MSSLLLVLLKLIGAFVSLFSTLGLFETWLTSCFEGYVVGKVLSLVSWEITAVEREGNPLIFGLPAPIDEAVLLHGILPSCLRLPVAILEFRFGNERGELLPVVEGIVLEEEWEVEP